MSAFPNASHSDAPAVVITGASSGIGQATAVELHARGYRVFAGIRRPEDGDRLLEQTSPRLVPVRIDVTDQDSITAAAESISAATGDQGVAGLVNNAGISVACVLEYLPIDQLRYQFETNVFGQLAMIQAMLPLIRRRPGGRIVNISSLSGLTAGPYVGPYAASKHAFEALSDSLRLELRGFGIHVAVVEPADIATPIWDKSQAAADRLRDAVLEKIGQSIPQDVQDVYRDDIAAMRNATRGFATKAIPVSRVVQAIVHALTAGRPRTRYRVGAKTSGVAYVLRNLPDRVRDRIVLRSLGMK